MKKLIATPLAAAVFVAALAGAAAAAPNAAPNHTVRDDARTVTVSRTITAPAPKPSDDSGIDRTFNPDYAHALTVDQMSAAWNDEINRVFETPITGGG